MTEPASKKVCLDSNSTSFADNVFSKNTDKLKEIQKELMSEYAVLCQDKSYNVVLYHENGFLLGSLTQCEKYCLDDDDKEVDKENVKDTSDSIQSNSSEFTPTKYSCTIFLHEHIIRTNQSDEVQSQISSCSDVLVLTKSDLVIDDSVDHDEIEFTFDATEIHMSTRYGVYIVPSSPIMDPIAPTVCLSGTFNNHFVVVPPPILDDY